MDTPKQESKQPTEAGFSTNMFLTHPIMGRLQFTFRGATSADWGVVLEDVDRFAHYMREKGWKFDGETKPEQAPAPTQAQPTPAPKPQTAEGNTMQIGKVKVTPEVKDGKNRIRVELFGSGHEYPDMKAFYDTAAEASAKWAMVTGLDFSQAGEYSLDCIATYRLSDKKNSKGNPYKNLVDVRPIE